MRLIDADHVLTLEEMQKMFTGETCCMKSSIQRVLSLFPTVEAVPVMHAHWGNWKSESGKVAGYVCNNCGFIMLDRPNDYLKLNDLRYCPHCGCKMIRDKKDEDSQNIRDYIHNQKFLG